MYKNKFKLSAVIAIAICLAGLTVFSGCEKDDDKAKKTLVGMWSASEIEPGQNHIIIFTKDFYVQQFIFPDAITPDLTVPPAPVRPYKTYSLSGDKITITFYYDDDDEQEIEQTFEFEYVLNKNSLTIKGFRNGFSTSTYDIKLDVHFTKIK
jgi:hypothetical protein